MSFIQLFIYGLIPVMAMMVILWLISIFIKNVSIVDIFWGFGFALLGIFYFIFSFDGDTRSVLVLSLVVIWGLRLTIYIGWRNKGKGEDFRYQNFRKEYGEKRYWWFSFFQTFLLQGVLMWIISISILASIFNAEGTDIKFLDYFALLIWLIGFSFEAGGDIQLAIFKSNPSNKGKVLDKGFWKYTRHPNYFGDAAVWWSFGLFSIASGSYLPVIGSLIMTFLLLKISGVTLLEKSLVKTKPQYQEYIEKTSSFIPWFPKK